MKIFGEKCLHNFKPHTSAPKIFLANVSLFWIRDAIAFLANVSLFWIRDAIAFLANVSLFWIRDAIAFLAIVSLMEVTNHATPKNTPFQPTDYHPYLSAATLGAKCM
jgi:hypothetical protein